MANTSLCYLVLEGLQDFLVSHLTHVQESNGDVAVPVAAVHRAETALADGLAELQVVEGYVPLAQRQLSKTNRNEIRIVVD